MLSSDYNVPNLIRNMACFVIVMSRLIFQSHIYACTTHTLTLLIFYLLFSLYILLYVWCWEIYSQVLHWCATSSNFIFREKIKKVRNWKKISYYWLLLIIQLLSAFYFSQLKLRQKSVIFYIFVFALFGFCCCCQCNFSLLIIWCCKNFVQMHRMFCAFFVCSIFLYLFDACLLTCLSCHSPFLCPIICLSLHTYCFVGY